MSWGVQNQMWYKGVVGALCLGAVLVGGCAKADVAPTQTAAEGLPRPNYIRVYDFAVTSQDVALDRGASAELARDVRGTPQTEEEIQVGRAVAAALSGNLVKELRNYGISAYRVNEAPPPSATTASIRGQFVQIDQGNRTLRTAVGFGLGGSEVQTRYQVYQGVVPNERLVAEGETSTQSSLKPGMGVMLGAGAVAGTIATTAAVSGGLTVASETLSATVEADAKRTAKEAANKVADYYKRQGWIAP